jgi:hypothetical protein
MSVGEWGIGGMGEGRKKEGEKGMGVNEGQE